MAGSSVADVEFAGDSVSVVRRRAVRLGAAEVGRHVRNSIIHLKNGVFTRGVLIDIPRLKGVPYLEPGTPLYVSDLEAWEKTAIWKRWPRRPPRENGGSSCRRPRRSRFAAAPVRP